MSLTRLFLASLAAACCLAAPPALAQQGAKPPTTDDCLACHGDPSATGANNRSVAVKPEAFAASIHSQSGLSCVDCHRDLATMPELPHPEKLQPVNCATCHEAAVQQYDQGVHAVARRTGGLDPARHLRELDARDRRRRSSHTVTILRRTGPEETKPRASAARASA